MFHSVPARFAVFVLFSLALAACGDAQGPEAGGSGPVAVNAQRVEARPAPLLLEAVGRAEGSREIEVRARVSGILEKQSYSEGAKVKAGAVLFQIDRVPYEVALEHARAALAKEQATRDQAQRNADRLTSLAAQRAVSQRQADDALSALEAAEAAVLAAKATLREAQINLSYTSVAAPIGGVTGRAVRSEGSLVTAGAESSLLTTVAQTDPIWVRFAVSVQEYEALRTAGARDASALSVELLRDGGEPRQGRVNFAASTVDPTVGAVQLRAEFPNPSLAVLPGEYLRVRLSGGEAPAIAVPQSAVLRGSQGPYVWTIDSEGRAAQRVVQTGAWVGDQWRIREGLAAGDTIILDNLLRLSEGQAVQVQLPAGAERVSAGEEPEARGAGGARAAP